MERASRLDVTSFAGYPLMASSVGFKIPLRRATKGVSGFGSKALNITCAAIVEARA